MKLVKRILPLVGLLVAVLVMVTAIRNSRQSAISRLVRSELNQLKNLDEETTLKYLTSVDLFPDTEEQTKPSDELIEVFQLFFRDFNYKVLNVKKSGNSAKAQVRLTTLDAASLSRDYVRAFLHDNILAAASASEQDTTLSLEDRCLLLNDLLSTNTYEKTTKNTVIELERHDGSWEILRTESLEDDLVGGLVSALSNPELLSPEETLQVTLDTLKEMTPQQLGTYLGIQDLYPGEDSNRQAIAEALTAQLLSHFDYEITDCSVDGYTATVSIEITTFDSESILNTYQEQMDAYLASAEAVIAGYDQRVVTSREMLLDAINQNEGSLTVPVTLKMVNDGVSWKLKNPGEELGPALFGALSEEDSTIYTEE